jgi:excisionase family DNA binding protein
MGKLINFANFTSPQPTRKEALAPSSNVDTDLQPSIVEVDHVFRITIDVLIKNNPGKTLFSLKEAAKQLTVGEEFIRRRIKSGKIQATYLGDKPFINIVELAHIITEGV